METSNDPYLRGLKSGTKVECVSNLIDESKEGVGHHHHRTYSDSMVTEEVPCWLKELLDEPETPLSLCRTHRRSSSDSVAFLQVQKTSQGNNFVTFPQETTDLQSNMTQKHPESSMVQHCGSYSNNPSISKVDSKRAKRHSAQQNRAKKVQYIFELERTIEALQVGGYGISAELEFLDQQNLILGMENRTLKQRLDSLSQVQFIKTLEQEMLEKEIARLRNLYHHQQHKQQLKHYSRPRSKNQDLDCSFANRGIEMQKAK